MLWNGPDPNRLAKQIIDQALDRAEKNPVAIALGRLGGLKGGKSRVDSLSADERKEIEKKAARARWNAAQGASRCMRSAAACVYMTSTQVA